MAGFFGLFNYEKAGPGIRKDAPKKKTFIVFFETYFRNFWKFIPINAVYTLFTILFPIAGLGHVGMTHVMRNTARDKHSFGLSDFFETAKKNWKQGLVAGIIDTLVMVILIFDLWFFRNTSTKGGTFESICLGLSLAVVIIYAMMHYYVWTLIITFKFKLTQIYRNSFKFVFLNFKNNLICGFFLILVYALSGFLFLLGHPIAWTIALLLNFCCLPSFRFLMIQYCAFPAIRKFIIDPYYEAHPGEDIEKRRSLGLEIPEEDEDEDDEEEDGEEDPDAPVFED